MDDLLLAARINGNLVERYPRIDVTARESDVCLALEGGSPSDEAAVQDVVGQMPGVGKIEVSAYPFMTPD